MCILCCTYLNVYFDMFFRYGMMDQTGTRWVGVRIKIFIHGYRYEYEILPADLVLPGGYLFYPTRCHPMATTIR
jgi:hypothetical protein